MADSLTKHCNTCDSEFIRFNGEIIWSPIKQDYITLVNHLNTYCEQCQTITGVCIVKGSTK